jgi:predicted RNase H-like HicB family nuclease
METRLTYTYWKDGDYFVGYLNDYPDDSTQGLTLAELEEALKEVYEIRQEEKLRLSQIRHTGILIISATRIHELTQGPRHPDINEYTAAGIIKKMSK